MQNILGIELSGGARYVVAAVFVVLLLLMLAWGLRRLTASRLRGGSAGGRARQPRLGVVDIYDLDRQRQLVLLRRDNTEHLVMIGGASDVVIETNILRSAARVPAPVANDVAAPAAAPQEFMPEPAPAAAPPAPAPRAVTPAVAPVIVAPILAALPRATEAQPPLAVAARPLPPEPASFNLTAAAPNQPALEAPKSVFPMEPAPAPKASASDLDDMSRQLEEALKRPFAAVRPSGAVTAAAAGAVVAAGATIADTVGKSGVNTQAAAKKLVEDKIVQPPAQAPEQALSPTQAQAPAQAQAPVQAQAPAQAKAPAYAQPPAPVEKAAEPVPTPAAQSTLGPAAVKPMIDLPPVPAAASAIVEMPSTPAAAIKPADAPPAAPAGFASLDLDAMEAEMASMLNMTPAAPVAGKPAVKAEAPKASARAEVGNVEFSKTDAAKAESAMAAAPKPAPVKAEVPGVEDAKQGPAGAEPRTEPKLTVSEPVKAPATEAAPAPVVDPFSVDAIEAEFARLLGRATPPPKG